MKQIKLLDIIIGCKTERVAKLMYLYMHEIDITVAEPIDNIIMVDNVRQADFAKYKRFAKLLGETKIAIVTETNIWG